jgi:lipid A 3-O-deacylase
MWRGGDRCRIVARIAVLAGFVCSPALAFADDNGLPPADPNAIVSFLWENSSITTSNLPDRYYVNGLDLGYVSPTGDLPDFVSNIGRAVWGDGNQRIAVDLSQWMYTPAATHVAPPPPNDEPYAGVLTADATLIQDTSAWRSMLGVDIGVLGPDSGAELVQNNFHSLIGQGRDAGWHYQMPNEPILQFTSERVWRIPTGHIGDLETDILPNLTIGVGNLWIYGLAGAVVRIGQGLASDYGVDRLGPGMSGGQAYTPVRPFDWYVFAGADGQAWLYNAVLAGEPFQATPSVSEKTLVGELEAGIAVIVHGVRVSYTQVFQTQTFYGEHGGLHQWGSLNAQFSF